MEEHTYDQVKQTNAQARQYHAIGWLHGISGMPQSDKDALMAWDTSEELGEVNYSCEDDNAACDV